MKIIQIIRRSILGSAVPVKNEKGQAIIELALMLPLLAVILMALVVTYEFSSKQVTALVTIRDDMRHSMNNSAQGSFRRNMKQKTIHVDVPGKMKWFFGTPFISQTLKIEFYEGSYHGKKKNTYQKYGTSLRQINL